MHMINGITDPKSKPMDLNGIQEEPAPRAPKIPPAKRITNGEVLTRIWANRNAWGEISWKVDQVREDHYSGSRKTHRGLYFEHLQDAMRGLYEAKRWIARMERRRNRSWFWWW